MRELVARTIVLLLAIASGVLVVIPPATASDDGASRRPGAPSQETTNGERPSASKRQARVLVDVLPAAQPAQGALVEIRSSRAGRRVVVNIAGTGSVTPLGVVERVVQLGGNRRAAVRVPFAVIGRAVGGLEVTARVEAVSGREVGHGSAVLWVQQGDAGLAQSTASPLDVRVSRAMADARAAGLSKAQARATADRIVQEDARAATDARLVAQAGSQDPVTVSGRATYEDRNGNEHPIRHAHVALYDTVSGTAAQATGLTDGSGRFSLEAFPNIYDEHNLYVEIRARNDNAAVVQPFFMDPDDSFRLLSEMTEGTPNGAHVTLDITGENSSEANGAFAVFDALVTGSRYLERDLGDEAGFVEVDYPTADASNNYDGSRLHIQLANYDNWDLVLHEYGHYVADEYDIEDNPGGSHIVSDNLSETGGRSKDEGTRMAWGEGWPTYFSISLQHEMGVASMGLPSAGDTSYHDLGDSPFEYGLEYASATYQGEDNEVAVQRWLWDLYDSGSESGDDVSWSDNSIWYDLKTGNPVRLSEAVSSLVPADVSPSYANGPNCLLTDHGIAPDLDLPTSYATDVRSNEPLEVSWDPAGGGPEYESDRFVVRFYDDQWQPLLQSEEVSANSFTPTRQQWDQVARGHGTGLIVTVTGRQTDSPQTGPYTSCGSPLEVEGAVDQSASCTAVTLPRNDDSSSAPVQLPFPVNYFGTTYTHTYVNNNGNITFRDRLGTYTPFRLTANTPPIIAPFFADVDTRGSGSAPVTYSVGETTFGGRPAFCVNWLNVGYFSGHYDKLNSFQLLLVDRSNVGVGDFDIVFNYDGVEWETGDASGGRYGLGGTSAGAGYSAGTQDANAFFELPGSLQNGAFLDGGPKSLAAGSRNSTVAGRYIFPVRNGLAPGGTGRISGLVTTPSPLLDWPVSDASVQVCPVDGGQCVYLGRTGSDGRYDANGLPPGEYNVTVYPPGDLVARPGKVGPVTLSAGQSITVDVELVELGGLPPGTTLEPSRPGSDGVTVTYWHDPLSLKTAGCPGGIGSYEVFLGTSSIAAGDLAETSPGSYSGTIPSLYPHHGYATIVVHIDCPPGTDDQTFSFDIYIDPSGLVQTPSGRPVPGATVTLLRSDSPDGPFTTVPDGSAIMSPANRQNPSVTDDRGHFGWDVIAGYYVVRAEKDGCTAVDGSGFVESPVLTIPPPVTDLDLRLVCNEPPVLEVQDVTLEGNTVGGFEGSIPGVSVTDPDGDEVQLASDAPALLPLGETQVTWTATDSEGDSTTKVQVVNVRDTTAPELTCPADIDGLVGEDVTIQAADAADVVDPEPQVSVNRPAAFGPGVTEVTHRAVDASGNVGTCVQKVTLTYDFDGFLSPIPQRAHDAQAGSALPFKWRLRDVSGELVRDVATTVSFKVDGVRHSLEALRFDTDHFELVVDTPTSWRGTTRKFTLKLDDGTRHSVDISFAP